MGPFIIMILLYIVLVLALHPFLDRNRRKCIEINTYIFVSFIRWNCIEINAYIFIMFNRHLIGSRISSSGPLCALLLLTTIHLEYRMCSSHHV
uniref:Uncharacterized protein n=1 Tax=Arundo donax TaxID=35708 RepID=A0A0A9E7E0_ARUDO